ncbi:MAG: UTP--glucose-1-phosphate uridylyltransferase [Gammaproteobacteria bacterium]|jgi:UTP--glucose-1-phosphate uridylyltransferase|nr:UTP--glucose-1-phosphate uridylyltransferase [Gammaproteobacteria bacterium]|tara:strand:+ start:1717 stop:2598 length:882 start_codon:yes stop_codon:yes gene_type:complete
MKNNKIKIAVFPVAGMGTRFLPATKANPKEMLPIVDKPLIQYATEEAVDAGIEILIFITGRNKVSIPNHFDKAYEIETELERRNKKAELDLVQNIVPGNVKCIYIRQNQALGLGHAVLCAKPAVGNNPFAVVLADDMILSKKRGCLKQMVDRYNELGSSILAVEKVQKENLHKYGIIDGSKNSSSDWELSNIVEKPDNNDAPSDMGVVGRYILKPSIFDILETTSKGAGDEIQLTDAIASQIKQEKVYAYEFEGKRFDCGNKFGFMKATIEYGLNHEEISLELKEYIKNIKID